MSSFSSPYCAVAKNKGDKVGGKGGQLLLFIVLTINGSFVVVSLDSGIIITYEKYIMLKINNFSVKIFFVLPSHCFHIAFMLYLDAVVQ
jgi:hypothetical protein